jgi:hypothetical protein
MEMSDVQYIGIDNGVSGSIGCIEGDGSWADMISMPTFSEQNYTKTKKNITRINSVALKEYLAERGGCVKVFLERPMVNPGRFMATTSALRALESTLIVIESLGYSLQYVDSKEWQKSMLPSGLKGPDELKKASLDIGKRLFPKLSAIIDRHKDADGLLMAEHFRRIQR